MPTYQEIYAAHADRYDALVDHEDRDKNVKRWLDRALSQPRDAAVEIGCGTGRLTRYVAPHFKTVRAYDGFAHMVERARVHAALENVTYGVSDNATLPERDASADLIIAGWTIGHLTGFYPGDWQHRANLVLAEVERVAKRDAAIVIFETLGTCTREPGPPNPRLAELYSLFETRFTRHELSTDYEFESVAQAVAIMGFFFGESMAQRVRELNARIVPEWTGVWFRNLPIA